MGVMKVRVFLVGQGVFCEAIRALLREWPDLELVGEASTWEAVGESMPPDLDVVIADRRTSGSPPSWSLWLASPRQIVLDIDRAEMVVYESRIVPATPQMLAAELRPSLRSEAGA